MGMIGVVYQNQKHNKLEFPHLFLIHLAIDPFHGYIATVDVSD